MNPEENAQLKRQVTDLERTVANLESVLNAVLEEVAALKQPKESQLTLPLDTTTRNLIQENLPVKIAEFVSGTPTLNGYITVKIDEQVLKLGTVS